VSGRASEWMFAVGRQSRVSQEDLKGCSLHVGELRRLARYTVNEALTPARTIRRLQKKCIAVCEDHGVGKVRPGPAAPKDPKIASAAPESRLRAGAVALQPILQPV